MDMRMKTVRLVGATGVIGQRILHEALSRGHKVTVAVRDALHTGEQQANRDYRTGDIFQPHTIAAAAMDHDVVVSAYGPGTNGDPEPALRATHAVIEALTRVEPIRLITVSTR
jgi:uncharacterized protein